jgi:hypothetical protein
MGNPVIFTINANAAPPTLAFHIHHVTPKLYKKKVI